MQQAIQEFLNYTASYKKYGEKIDLKIKHTMRVKDLCEEIAKSISLSQEEIDIATLCGLLHDIGRFEQWKNYNSYEDRETVDHGNLGYKILKNNNLIHRFNQKEEYDKVILKSVKYHNKYRIAKSMTKKEKLFANIVRDADKLDILHLYKINVFKVAKEDKAFNKDIYQNLLNKELVSKELVKSKTDMEALRLGFVFDFNFKKSYEILKKENYINDTIEKQLKETKNEELKEQLNNIKIILNEYIEEKIKC